MTYLNYLDKYSCMVQVVTKLSEVRGGSLTVLESRRPGLIGLVITRDDGAQGKIVCCDPPPI